nr:unnamed protein product [Meloidogyne enterolobii]
MNVIQTIFTTLTMNAYFSIFSVERIIIVPLLVLIVLLLVFLIKIQLRSNKVQEDRLDFLEEHLDFLEEHVMLLGDRVRWLEDFVRPRDEQRGPRNNDAALGNEVREEENLQGRQVVNRGVVLLNGRGEDVHVRHRRHR